MALKIVTTSGSRYILSNGRVTRCSIDRDDIPPIIRECFKHLRPLAVGRPMVLQIAGKSPLVSTPVREIDIIPG